MSLLTLSLAGIDGDGDGYGQSHSQSQLDAGGRIYNSIRPYTTLKICVKTQLSPGLFIMCVFDFILKPKKQSMQPMLLVLITLE